MSGTSVAVMFFVFMIIVALATFVLVVVYMGLRHAQNMKRIAHGYPTLDGSLPLGHPERKENHSERLQ